jgi:hypothetical protein
MFLSLPVLKRLEVLRQLKASLDGSGFNQLPSLDDLAASFLEQRQQGTQPSPSAVSACPSRRRACADTPCRSHQ